MSAYYVSPVRLNRKGAPEIIESKEWGDFSVYKEFSVSHPEKDAKDIYGYVIQKVIKRTKVFLAEGDAIKTLTKEDEILAFTNGQVNYANSEYYEVFFIRGGRSESADSFQNGALLHYNVDDVNDIYADDEVPTAGVISMVGESYFREATEKDVLYTLAASENPDIQMITILGADWSTDTTLPANGLPYRAELPIEFTNVRDSNTLQHVVKAVWNGIGGSINGINTRNTRNKVKPITKKTQVSSVFSVITA